MFRHLWLGLTLIAATSAFLLVSDWKQRSAGPRTVPRVAILQFSSLQLLDDGTRGLIDQLKADGYDGPPRIILDRFNAENDAATNNSMAREITSGRYDYVFSISTNCLQAVANANRAGRAKHVFGVVADPLAAKVGINPKDPMDHPKHMVGVGTLMPVDEVLEWARKMNPRFQRMGVPWNPSQANTQRFMELAREKAKELNLELLEGSVDNTNAVAEVTSSLVSRGAEAMLVVGDVTVMLGIDAVIAESRKGRIPVITLAPDDVTRGALLGGGANFYAVGKQMGELGTRLLKGEDPARIPILYSVPKKYGVNLTGLAGLKDVWRVPPELVAKASIVVDESGTHQK